MYILYHFLWEEILMKKSLPIGVENFEMLVTEDYFYIDKTMFIKELLDKKASVNLFTRPRRFGKTLMLSMLQYYFEDVKDRRGNKKEFQFLFDGLAIMKQGEKYTKHMGHYPVISLTLKSGRQNTLESSLDMLKEEIIREYKRHEYILQDDYLSDIDKSKYREYMMKQGDLSSYKRSLRFLCECLQNFYDKRVIILIDEYDVPLEGAYTYGFYQEMVDFIREFLGSALKTNNSLQFAVLTGCLRISKESIFTGLNNLRINSILTESYGEYFGFTEREVRHVCEEYELESKYDEIKDWYNGYEFGKINVYNPWSVIQYIYDHVDNKNAYPISYWANTSSNSIVKDLINHADNDVKEEIEKLIAGGTITIPVHEDITYDEVYDNKDNLWNFMFFTGYFKKVKETFNDDVDKRYVTLQIANREVHYIFKEKIQGWFEQKVKEADRSKLFDAVITGNADIFRDELQKLLKETISFQDFYENFYHGFTVGVLSGMKDYITKSNREAGDGRSDIFIKPVDRTKPAYVLELKVAESIVELEPKAYEAIEQIIDKHYEQELYDDGYIDVKRYGIAFFKKNCMVKISEKQKLIK